MNWTKILVKSYCLLNGYKIKELKTKEELKASFDLKNKANLELYGLPPLPEVDEFIYPKGGAYLIGIYKKRVLIGAVHLMDLTKIASYASKSFSIEKFNHNPLTTYEIKGLVVDLKHQNAAGTVFKILIYYCIIFTEKMNRNKWVVVTSRTFYQLIKRSKLKTILVADDDYDILKDVKGHFGIMRGVDMIEILGQPCTAACTALVGKKEKATRDELFERFRFVFIGIDSTRFHQYAKTGDQLICISQITSFRFRQMTVDGTLYRVKNGFNYNSFLKNTKQKIFKKKYCQKILKP